MNTHLKSLKWRFLNLFTSLQLSIIFLLIIAFVTMLGTFIEQDRTIEFYQENYSSVHPILGFVSWKLILAFGLDHIYTNVWFYILLIIFAISLLTCTFSKQLPIFKISRTWLFYTNRQQFLNLPLKLSLDINVNYISSSICILNKQGYFVFQKQNSIFAHKGLIGRISPIIVHFSILCILLGNIISASTGFVVQQVVPKGESFHIHNIFNAGNLTVIPQNLVTTIKDFWIIYNVQGSVDQFFSNIILRDPKGKIVKEGTISVNHPLRYQGLSIYQTDWSISGIKLLVDSIPMQLTANSTMSVNNTPVWIVNFSLNSQIDEDNNYFFIIQNLKGIVDIYDHNQKFVLSTNLNQVFMMQGFQIKILEILTSTGLQIKSDQGIPIVYSGFLCLILSTLFSYFTYSRVWILFDSSVLFIGGRSNRDFVNFEEDFYNLVKNI
uniref:Cytochrome c biogenesis protein CcsB n=1 Tax=Rhodochaete parvula TaxID=110510 RepID=A0A1X9PUQ0_9RHOD|nr:cytochrome c biogenesis protein ccs1 [Rhodochaete parvula]ASK39692.1 c-type cytochrome biogenensis protein [Rhodochaete parvula]